MGIQLNIGNKKLTSKELSSKIAAIEAELKNVSNADAALAEMDAKETSLRAACDDAKQRGDTAAALRAFDDLEDLHSAHKRRRIELEANKEGAMQRAKTGLGPDVAERAHEWKVFFYQARQAFDVETVRRQAETEDARLAQKITQWDVFEGKARASSNGIQLTDLGWLREMAAELEAEEQQKKGAN